MSRTIPVDHPLVKAVVFQLCDALDVEHDNHEPRFSSAALEIIAELVSASLPLPRHYLNPAEA